ncbi:hypothetical protein TYRP_010578 [Tyrophagus putrescentiae]|nr:hypothetical protein TYRP_010578 [Tyrophagus putrescentiae]
MSHGSPTGFTTYAMCHAQLGNCTHVGNNVMRDEAHTRHCRQLRTAGDSAVNCRSSLAGCPHPPSAMIVALIAGFASTH